MEKIIDEEELKILEEEIDSAVDRLFVETKKTITDTFSTEPLTFEPLIEPPPSAKPPPQKPSPTPIFLETPHDLAPSTTPPSPSNWLDKMESRLLSLEWEITEENLLNTKEEVIGLKEALKENPSAISILNLMGKALDYMIQSKGNVHPSFIQFLLDSKETLRLLLEEERDKELRTYKQLAFKGIEARFACLEPMQKVVIEPPTLKPETDNLGLETLELLEKKVEKISDQVDSFSKRIEESIQKIQESLFEIDRRIKDHLESPIGEKSLMAKVLIFKVNGRLFGIESEKVFKLFRIPSTHCEKYANCERLQLKDLEVKMVNLKRVYSMEGEPQHSGEVRILTVKDNGEFKGLMIDEIINRSNTQLKIHKTEEPYALGMIEWSYQNKPVNVPILDLKRL